MFFCLKIFFTFTNNVDPDEMQHYAAFHLGLHCLQKYSFRVSRIQRVTAPSIAMVGEIGKGTKYNINLSISRTIHIFFVCCFNGFYATPLE